MSKTTKEEILKLIQPDEFRQQKREIEAIQRDIGRARQVIEDGIARYKKARLRVRNKKIAEENPFADLDEYTSLQDIQDAYGFAMISETERDRLSELWDAREASLSASGKYEDRVTQMLVRALNGIGKQFMDQLSEFYERERKLNEEAERIANENRQREWERKYGGHSS